MSGQTSERGQFTIEKVLNDHFYTGEPGQHGAIKAAAETLRSFLPAQAARVPKVRTSHHRNKEEAARLQELVAKRYAAPEPVAYRIYCTTNGATGYLYTEVLPFDPGHGVRVRREPEPLYALSSTDRQPCTVHNAIAGIDGKWRCQNCGEAIEMAVALSSTEGK